jgi:hypothetical protein
MTITNGYLSLEELRDVLRDQLTAYDHEYERAIEAGSRQLDDYCGRHFYATSATARTYRPNQTDLLWCGDISTTTGLVVKTDEDFDGVYETTWTIDEDFILEPFERMNAAYPYERIAAVGSKAFPVAGINTSTGLRASRRPPVQVTAAWGFPSIPPQVKEATVITAMDHFRAKDLMHVASTYGNDVRVARDQSPGLFGRKTRFARVRAPSLNPEAEALVASLRITVVA